VGGCYLARRLLLFPPTLVGASILIFVLLRLVPGDIAEILVYQTGSESSVVQQKQIRQLRAELGLDRPVAVQYVDWLGKTLRGDFGQSYSQKRPVAAILKERVPRSLEAIVGGDLGSKLYDCHGVVPGSGTLSIAARNLAGVVVTYRRVVSYCAWPSIRCTSSSGRPRSTSCVAKP